MHIPTPLLNCSRILGLFAVLAAAAQATVTRGPYLQMATDESVVIVWRSDEATEPVVRYGASPDALDQVERSDYELKLAPTIEGHFRGKLYSRLHSAPGSTRQYEMRVSGLKPDTRYFYAIYDGEEQIGGGDADHFFYTHPKPGSDHPIRIWAVGDSGKGDDTQKGVYNGALKVFAGEGKPASMYLHVGDMAYGHGLEEEFQKAFFDIYQATLRNTVCWPSMGNHEGHTSDGRISSGPYYDAYVTPSKGEVGGVISGTEAFYSFNYGRAHFICLNSYDVDRDPDAAMARWLKADLEATDADWLIGFFHHPPYTKGSHDSDTEIELIEMRENIMPILEDYGVDMVLTGHSHIYERSMLIDKAYATPTVAEGVVLDDGDGHIHGDGAYRKSAGLHAHEGVAQLVLGHGGPGVGRDGAMPVMRKVRVEHGSMIIDIDGDTLTSRMINSAGETTDTFNIVKRGKVKQKIVKNPWTPVGPVIEPANGEVSGDLIIRMTTSGYWEGAEIRYSLDGTEPNKESRLYKGPIKIASIKARLIVRARSYKGDGIDPSLDTRARYFPEGQLPVKKKNPRPPPQIKF